MKQWLTTLLGLQQELQPAVMVTVASTVGSTPREPGARMIVTLENLVGTIGGGNLEHQACSIARDQLSSCQARHLRRFPLGAGLGQCCGGLVNLLFEPVTEATGWLDVAAQEKIQNEEWVRIVATNESHTDNKASYFIYSRQAQYSDFSDESLRFEFGEIAEELLNTPSATRIFQSRISGDSYFAEVHRRPGINLTVFGAGHVGRALVKVLSELDINIRWVDSREDQFPRDYPDNVEIICDDIPEAEVDVAMPGCYFLVLTHDHGLDQRLTEHILKRDDFTYFGLIGSDSKRRNFETRMKRRGFDASCFKRMTCPIGLDGIRSKQPAVIAISVAAQIMQVYDQSLISKIDRAKVRKTLEGNV